MAGQAQKRGLPPQLPLMASLVESGMKNLNFGDADSVGFFQMRVGIWNQGAYAGYPEDPQLQVKWFLDQAEAVKKQRLVAGKSIDDPSQFGEWIADVERPAEQYRGRYQTKLEEANGLLGVRPRRPRRPRSRRPRPSSIPPPPRPARRPSATRSCRPRSSAPVQAAIAAGQAPGPKALKAIEEASKYMGTDYKWGGSTPQTGFDCSGLMQWSYAQSGVQIPRVTYTQIEAPNGTEVANRTDLKPGDLIFFENEGDVHHVGMYLGDQKFLHAPSTGDVVKVSSLDEPYFSGQFAGGRRFDAGAPVAAAPAPRPGGRRVAAAARRRRDRPDRGREGPGRGRARRGRGPPQQLAAVPGDHRRAGDQGPREEPLDDVPQGDRPVAGRAPRAGGRRRGRPAARVPRRPWPRPPPCRRRRSRRRPLPRSRPPRRRPGSRPRRSTSQAPPPTTPATTRRRPSSSKWLAKQAEKSGLPPELPVMAALVESGVKNLNFGDADSVGFFQMRVGIWNKGAYAGYPDKPELQAKWFIDTALAVKRKAIADGDADFGKDPAKFGEWIANVERPAEQYRGRYQLRLNEARKLLEFAVLALAAAGEAGVAAAAGLRLRLRRGSWVRRPPEVVGGVDVCSLDGGVVLSAGRRRRRRRCRPEFDFGLAFGLSLISVGSTVTAAAPLTSAAGSS